MACSIVQGYEIACRDSVGGVREIYIAEFSNVQSYVESSGVVTAITMVSGTKFYTYQLEKENAQFDDNGAGSLENGTTYHEGTLTFTMKKMSASMQNSIKVLMQSRLVVLVKDNNDTVYCMGLTRGADCLQVATSTGKAFGDMSGATVTITSKEPAPAQTFTGTVQTLLT